MTTPTPANGGSFGEKYNFSWQQVMLRIKDPRVSIPFYEENFGMKLVHFYNFRAARFSVYFLERPRDGAKMPTPGTAEAEEYLWNMKGTCLELTYNHGSESDENFSVNNGNVLPYRGFGHIAFNCDDIEVAALELEKNGVSFYKKPHEGCIKTIAFALDPDGYWIELCNRSKTAGIKEKYNLSQTMLRVKDAEKSLAFYRDILGMKLIMKKVHLDFTIYFLAFLPPGVEPPRDVEVCLQPPSNSLLLKQISNNPLYKERNK
ncbi:lactoylglutathione lyase, putative [Eimeria brunetti]|uniref:lactoylglutathione lyase n=1 Tax=Eimeria brunetti TaxID=51314 RepID=U6L7F1_9EIME|nr:lactoylglutathione lyase, putative [Eimeria brunetti]